MHPLAQLFEPIQLGEQGAPRPERQVQHPGQVCQHLDLRRQQTPERQQLPSNP
jgi:hypothetical protein